MEKPCRERAVLALRREPSNARSGFHSAQFPVRSLEQRRLPERFQREVERPGVRQRKRGGRSSRLASLQRESARERLGFVETPAAAAHVWKSKRTRGLLSNRLGRQRRRGEV